MQSLLFYNARNVKKQNICHEIKLPGPWVRNDTEDAEPFPPDDDTPKPSRKRAYPAGRRSKKIKEIQPAGPQEAMVLTEDERDAAREDVMRTESAAEKKKRIAAERKVSK